MKTQVLTALVVSGVLIAACGRDTGKPGNAASAGRDTAAAAPMGGMNMGDMSRMGGMGMMPAMRQHMDSMSHMSASQMSRMMAAHDQQVSAMLDAMGGDMRQMGVQGDTAWNALTDSVRRDLADLPGLSGDALTSRMRAHLERMRRLMAEHERMMQSR